jgi:DNA processing protein
MLTDQFILSFLANTKIRFSMADFISAMHCLKQVGSLRHRDFLARFPQILQVLRAEGKNYFSDLERLCEKDLLCGYQFTYPGHPLYPEELMSVSQPPFFLQYQGSPIWMAQQGFSVVGNREPTALTEAWFEATMHEFMQSHAMYSISGGARGVDQLLHKASLRNHVPTVALLPCGLNKIYPASLNEIRQDILDQGGALLTEYSSSEPMDKRNFISRNRLIAGLGLFVLIVEARHRSGTMITARYAIDQHKPVLVVPSHPFDVKSQGGLELLCEGAGIVRDAIDLRMHFESEKVRLIAAISEV